MPESAKTATNNTDQSKEPQMKKSLLAQVVAQELGTSSNSSENKKPAIPSFSWDFGKKKTDNASTTNGKDTASAPKTESSSGSGFIFGSRLADKVTNVSKFYILYC